MSVSLGRYNQAVFPQSQLDQEVCPLEDVPTDWKMITEVIGISIILSILVQLIIVTTIYSVVVTFFF